jgi:metal-sulfur cluster biosynthetic enzyme
VVAEAVAKADRQVEDPEAPAEAVTALQEIMNLRAQQTLVAVAVLVQTMQELEEAVL